MKITRRQIRQLILQEGFLDFFKRGVFRDTSDQDEKQLITNLDVAYDEAERQGRKHNQRYNDQWPISAIKSAYSGPFEIKHISELSESSQQYMEFAGNRYGQGTPVGSASWNDENLNFDICLQYGGISLYPGVYNEDKTELKKMSPQEVADHLKSFG
jgi:hypothetical protein